MKRPAGVIVTAVLQVLGSLFVLLMAGMMVIVPRFASKSPDTPQVPTSFFLAIGVVYLLFAVLGVATAVGIFQLKRWARYSTLIYSGFLAAFGLVAAVVSAFIPQPPSTAGAGAQLPSNFEVVFKTFMVLTWLGIGGMGGWWLYYFNRRDIRARFQGGVAEAFGDGSRRPLSIVLLAVLHLFTVPWALVGLWKPFPLLLFGVLLRGAAARLGYAVFLVVVLYLGIGLLQLLPSARVVAIWFYAFGWINTVVSWGLPGREDRYQQMLAESGHLWGLPVAPHRGPEVAIGMVAGVALTLLFSVVAIYFLIARRPAFEPGAIHP